MNFHTKDAKMAGFLVYSGIPVLYKEKIDGVYWYTFSDLKATKRIYDAITDTIHTIKKIPTL